jgi:hypothetical protein
MRSNHFLQHSLLNQIFSSNSVFSRISSLVFAVALSASLTSCQNLCGGAPTTPGMVPTVLNASPSEAAQTQRLWSSTLQSISRAKQSLEANDANAQRNLTYVFGSKEEAYRREVLKRISLMDNKARRCRYTVSLFEGSVPGFEGRMSIAAHTAILGAPAISLNKIQLKGGFLAEGVIAHELSHNAAGTDDFAYGRNVHLDMAKRVRNADNYSLLIQHY